MENLALMPNLRQIKLKRMEVSPKRLKENTNKAENVFQKRLLSSDLPPLQSAMNSSEESKEPQNREIVP